PGKLGVETDSRPVPVLVARRRASAEILRGSRAGSLAPLPGTRDEVEAISALFPAQHRTTLYGPDARAANIRSLARDGKLRGFRFLHLATHGRLDADSAYRTALQLAPDPPGSDDDPAGPGPYSEITAEEVARTWNLDADLVVLSDCETALGKLAGGEGF